jgi:K+-transporting ATPase ATPase C chain
MKNLKTALIALATFTVLLGIVYPLVITGISQLVFPVQANGSLIEKDGKIIGSRLIGQEFAGNEFFRGRPSNSAYSEGTTSNIALSNPEFLDRAAELYEHARLTYGFEKDSDIPSDLVMESASGLDPDITLEAALVQVKSVAAARNIDPADLEKLVRSLAKKGMGFDYVNVLELNIALEEMEQ